MNSSKKSTCPGHDVFVRAFMKECTPAETERLVTHVMSCPPCWEKFQAMRRVKTEATGAFEHTQDAKSPTYGLTLRLAAVFGSAFVLLLGLLFFLKIERPVAIRGSGSGRLGLLEPAGIIHFAPVTLRCTPVSGADWYSFKVIDENLETIVETGSKEPRLALVEETRAKLIKGKTYLWTVTVTDDRSSVIEKSSKSFEIR